MKMKIPIQIDLENLTMKHDQVYLQYNNQKYELVLPDLEELRRNRYSLKLIHYLLTSKYAGVSHLHIEQNICKVNMATPFNHVDILHDPEPNHTFSILPFSSLASVQWHLLAHGIADFWLYNRPTLLQNSEEENSQIWKTFQEQVGCARWADIDFCNVSKNKARSEWKKRRSKYKHGCDQCIKDQGMDQFIKCCLFLERYRYEYLNKIHHWIIDTIKDQSMLYGYQQHKKPDQFIPNRRHIHCKKNTRASNDIYAYVIDRNDTIYCVYLIIFEQKDRINYQIKTCYGLKNCHSKDRALRRIFDHPRNKKVHVDYYCHEQNWG